MPRAKTLKCPQCSRTFSMAGHLGRHLAAIHGAPTKTRKSQAQTRRQKPDGFDGVLQSLQNYHGVLLAQRAEVDQKIDAIGMAVGAMTGSTAQAPPSARPGRGRRANGSLKDYIEKVLQRNPGPRSIRDITARVLRAGYKSKNKTLDTSVGIALTQIPRVKRVSRGVYQLT